MTASLWSYISLTFVLVITPGVTTAVIIQHTLRHGHRIGAAAALGAACGNTTYALFAGLGLAVLLRQWPEVLAVLRIAGALYLCWLAIRLIRRAWAVTSALEAGASVPDVDHTPALKQGFTVTVLNPSVATFYFVVLPGFLSASAGARVFAGLAAIHVTMALACHLMWALTLGSVRSRAGTPSMLRALDAAAGVTLLILGVRMLIV